MEEKNYILLADIVSREPRSLQFMASHGFTVIARHKAKGRERSVPVRTLLLNNSQFFRKTSSYEYFITRESAEQIFEAFPSGSASQPKSTTVTAAAGPTADAQASLEQKPPNFGAQYQQIVNLRPEQRIELIHSHAKRFEELSHKSDLTEIEVNQSLTAGVIEAALVNKATILDALRMGNAEAQRYSASLVSTTEKMVESTGDLLARDLYKEDLISDMVKKSNGIVVQHMTRVFLMGFSFLLYYNRQYSVKSLPNYIRAHFARRYRPVYKKLLPHLNEEDITLERVFWGGMRALTMDEIRNFAMGYLVHDVGKAEDIEYHEGEAGFDREKIVRHVKIGYKAVMEKTVYPREAALITGYHHEYYGDPSGYGYFRELLDRYKKMRPDARIDHLMSYEMEPLIDYQVLAYFPAKMLEVVDVFDSLTDPNRLYRDPLTPVEAITMLYTDFVKKKVKVDPIILDLFKAFLQERGMLS